MATLQYQSPITSMPPRRVSRLLWIGLAMLIVGTGPLAAIILAASLGLLSDPNPNPIGPGLLAFFTFWPSVALLVVGAIRTLSRRRT